MFKSWQRRAQHSRYKKLADLPLIHAVIQEEPGAWEAFIQRAGHLLYILCASIFTEEECRAEYHSILADLCAENFALLRAFDGRSSLQTYLTLTLRSCFAVRILKLFGSDPNRAWRAFEQFFKQDILHIIARYFPAERAGRTNSSTHEDRYQDVCLWLIEQEYRRIKAYDGHGSFAGYIRHVVRHLCVDLWRQEVGRRRLPERVQQLFPLAQAAFKLLYWEGQAEDTCKRLLEAQGGTPQQVEQALSAVRQAMGSAETPPARVDMVSLSASETTGAPYQPAFPDPGLSPEETLIESEEQATQEKLQTVLREVITQMPADTQLYLRLRFFTTPPQPPRVIARLMGRSEKEIYRLREQAFSSLKVSLKARGLWEISGTVRL